MTHTNILIVYMKSYFNSVLQTGTQESVLRRIQQLRHSSKGLAVGGVFAITAIGAILLFNEDRNMRIKNRFRASYRVFNLTSTAIHIAADYGYNLYWLGSGSSSYELKELQLERLQQNQEDYTIKMLQSNNPAEQEMLRKFIVRTRFEIDTIIGEMAKLSEADKERFSLHHRNAVRLRDMCASNGGVYIKLGQHLAMLDHIFPKEYQVVLNSLLSKTPQSSWQSVRRVFKQDIGRYPEEIFEEIDPKPIASASLAQVHIAKGKDGRKYAVKVQHEGLHESSAGDMAAITYIVHSIPFWFRGMNYGWLADEMNINLPKELNFEEERRNLSLCTKNLSALISKGDVAVPHAVDSLSSNRILTMSFEEGCYLSDSKAIKEMGLRAVDISKLVSTTFCEQIYRHGFVHCGK